jgi:PAS domain-containing protein
MEELSNRGSRPARGKPARNRMALGSRTEASDGKLNGPETRVQHLLAVSPAIIYTNKASGDFPCTFVSENLQAIMGYSPSEMIGDQRCWTDHLHPEDAPRVFEEMRR